jgi:hypothetical protein
MPSSLRSQKSRNSLEHGVIEGPSLSIESCAVNLNCVQDVCGVKELPLFDAIYTDHFVPPTLHITIGKGNNILENLTSKLQAAGEAYSANYYKTERNATLAILSLEKSKEVQQFNDRYSKYKAMKSRNDGGLRAIAEDELEDIALVEQVGIQDAVDGANIFVFKTKKAVCRREEKGGELQGHRPASPCRDS